MEIKTLMRSPAAAIEEDELLPRARELMARDGIRQLPVVRRGTVVGVLTDRDMRRAEPSTVPALARYEWPRLLDTVRVRDVMTHDAATLPPRASVQTAARLFRQTRLECLPVVDEGNLVGVVAMADLLGLVIGGAGHRREAGFRILMAVSFGRLTSEVGAAAVPLAGQQGAELTALHVLPPLSRRFAAEGVPAEILAKIAETRERDALEQLEALFGRTESVRVACQVVIGDPGSEIVNAADRTEADLIVMGMRRRGVPAFLGRHVTESVIHHAPCPVLVVGRQEGGARARR